MQNGIRRISDNFRHPNVEALRTPVEVPTLKSSQSFKTKIELVIKSNDIYYERKDQEKSLEMLNLQVFFLNTCANKRLLQQNVFLQQNVRYTCGSLTA